MKELSPFTAGDIADEKKHWAGAIAGFTKMTDGWREFCAEMRPVRERELWRLKAKSFTEYVDKLGASLGKSPRWLFQLLRADFIKQKVKKKLTEPGFSKNAESLAKTLDSMEPKALLAVGAVDEAVQVPVLEKAAAQFNGKAPTAAAVAATAKVHKAQGGPDPNKTTTWPKDEKGTPIPPPAWPFWERRDEVQPTLTTLTRIKSEITKALSDGDALFAWIGNPAIDFLSSAYAAISNAKLYAVCTVCQGWGPQKGGCADCHNTGLISKHHYDVCSKREVKAIRERANLQR